LTLLGFTFLFSGCSQKEQKVVIKKEYIYEKPYKFETVDLKGAYIELGTKEIQRTCTPSLLELNEIYTGIKDYYEWQFDTYAKDKNDSTRQK
jgi:hypothetical protein